MKYLQKLVGKYISKIIMHSQLLPKYDFETVADWEKFIKLFDINLQIKRKFIDSTNGASLDVCEIYSKSNHEKVIIHAMAAGDSYERHLREYMLLARQFPKCKIVSFNFRNVQASTGTAHSEEDWIEDAIAVIENARKQGYAYSDIVLTGHSLGGAIITIAASRIFLKNRQKNSKTDPLQISVKVINNRSFSTLTNEILHSILRGPGSGFVSGILYGGLVYLLFGISIAAAIGVSLLVLGFFYPSLPKLVLKPWIESFISITFGNLDALSAYKILPENAKDYIFAKNDCVIDALSSLHHGLKQSAATETRTRSNISKVKTHSLSELLNYKDSKICYTSSNGVRIGDSLQSHFLPLSALSTINKKRNLQIKGDEVMVNKIKRLLTKKRSL